MRPMLSILAIALLVAGCGHDTPTGNDSGTRGPIYQPPAQQPGYSQQDPRIVQAILGSVAQTYQRTNTLTADYDIRQEAPGKTYTATVKFSFAKPRKLRMEIQKCSDSLREGAVVVWPGFGKVKAKKSIGFININKEHEIGDRDALSVRGYRMDENDLHAMVQALLNPQSQPRLAGKAMMGGRQLDILEIRPALAGGTSERIGIDPSVRLPVYRELREGSKVVYYQLYTNVRLNAPVKPDAFTL